MSSLVLRDDCDGVATLTLNRPEKLNALSIGLFQALKDHVERLSRQEETVGVVVLRGAGRCFSAGHDLQDPDAARKPHPNFQANVIEALSNLPQPVVVAVHGYCYTGALELALAGDIIIASRSARFADTHARWGFTPAWGLSQRLPRRIGASKAAEMTFTCRDVGGEEAAAIGLANLCVADEAFDAEVRAFCGRIAQHSWFSHRGNKALLRETDGLSLVSGLAHETHRSPGKAPDSAQRVAAFAGRRRGEGAQ